MSEFDLVLKNGTVFLPSGRENTDIGIKKDKIVFIGDIGDSNNFLDCKNLFIFPGLIDTQCHFREPGGEHKETIQTGTMSAALGGITGIFEMPNTNPLTTTPEALEHKIKRGVDTAYTDFAFYFGGTHENSSNLPEWEKLPGVCGIKIFMGSSTGNLLSATDEEVEAVVANGRRVIAVHAEDEFIMNENKKTILKDSNDVGMHCKWRNVESALNATQAGYEVGTRNIVDLLSAQRALFQAKRNYANSKYDYIFAMMSLKEVAGQLSPQDIYQLNAWLDPKISVTR